MTLGESLDSIIYDAIKKEDSKTNHNDQVTISTKSKYHIKNTIIHYAYEYFKYTKYFFHVLNKLLCTKKENMYEHIDDEFKEYRKCANNNRMFVEKNNSHIVMF